MLGESKASGTRVETAVGSIARGVKTHVASLRLAAYRSLDASEDFGRRDAQGPTNANQRVHGRALVVIFEQAQVRAVDPSRHRDLLLRQVGSFSCFPQFLSKCHDRSVNPLPRGVCLLLQTKLR